jgi:hypothetical protein
MPVGAIFFALFRTDPATYTRGAILSLYRMFRKSAQNFRMLLCVILNKKSCVNIVTFINLYLTTGILMFDDTGRYRLLRTRFTSPSVANTISSHPTLLLFAKCKYDPCISFTSVPVACRPTGRCATQLTVLSYWIDRFGLRSYRI